MGCTPPDGIRLVRARPAGLTRKMETSLLPALTANSQRPSALKTTAPCDPRPLPVPVPPVATVPATVSVPSAARAKTATAFPDVRFIRVYTAPGAPSAAAALAASRAAVAAAGPVIARSRLQAATPAASAARAMCLCIMWTSLAVSGCLYASGEERPHTTRRIRRGRVMRGFSYSSHAPCRGGGAPGRSVSRASAAWIGQRGVPEYPCTVSSKPRSDWETVATGNHHTSALGVRSTSTFRATDSSGQKKRSEEHTSELQSRLHLVCRLLLEKKKKVRSRQLPRVRYPRRHAVQVHISSR